MSKQRKMRSNPETAQATFSRRLAEANMNLAVKELRRVAEGRYEVIFPEPVDFTNLGSCIVMPAEYAYLDAKTILQEEASDHLIIDCVKVEIRNKITGKFEDCDKFELCVVPALFMVQLISECGLGADA